MQIQLLLVFFTLTFLRIFFKKLKERKLLQNIPGPSGIPMLGNSLQLAKKEDLIKKLSEWTKKYGTRFKFSIGLRRQIYISNAKDAEKILTAKSQLDKGSEYEFHWPWIGINILTSAGSKWETKRKMVDPAFHARFLINYLEIINEQCQVLMRHLETRSEPKQEFDISSILSRVALGISIEAAVGKDTFSFQEGSSEYLDASSRLRKVIHHRTYRPWLQPNIIWRFSPSGREESRSLAVLHSLTDKIVEKKKAEKESIERSTRRKKKNDDYITQGKSREVLLDCLLDHQKKMKEPYTISDAEIRQEIDAFVFAGHETTKVCVGWALFLLGHNPICQTKLHEELNQIFGTDLSRPVTSQDLKSMKYTEMCIKETLRLYPSVPWISRDVYEDFHLDQKTVLPKGVSVSIFVYQIHRDPEVFPNPEDFIPERFSTENSSGRDAFAFLPFSGGKRDCIGQRFALMELKVLLANIVRKFHVQSMTPKDEVVLISEQCLTPGNGILVRLRDRD